MEKPADTHHPIHDLLRRRWSPRAFADRPLEPDKLKSLFEAARWAPSSNNEQPWRFIVTDRKENRDDFDRLFACLSEGNKKWVHLAPVLMLSVASLNFEDDGKPNRHAMHDTGLAVENLVLQATALGLQAHQMAGFDVERARTDCGIPPGFEPVAMIAVGYPGDPAVLPEYLQERERKPRERRPIGESVVSGQWGRRFD
ncbi:Nitroreductase [Nitrospira sp. KM1]|uniref:nitroreductase family protein n=1 Tax=Nitrospira sp. KM1 TaxID=1936990 RepID=UPI0013A793BB|nr:nitroreductase family protein [Nitrospira sp. KM1]BCA55275.1 Nitroreductase [Nitrospira sp. KM1]